MKLLFMSPEAEMLEKDNNSRLLKFHRDNHIRLLGENELLRQQIANYEDLARRAGIISRGQEEGISRLLADMQIEVNDNDAA